MSQWTVEEMKSYLKGKIATLEKDINRSNQENNNAKIDAYTDALCLLMDWSGE